MFIQLGITLVVSHFVRKLKQEIDYEKFEYGHCYYSNKMFYFGLVWFYGISTIVGYLMPNLFLYILIVLFQTVQFNISIQFKCQKQFYFKQFSLILVHILVLFNP